VSMDYEKALNISLQKEQHRIHQNGGFLS